MEVSRGKAKQKQKEKAPRPAGPGNQARHLNQGLVVLALATVCACVGFLPHGSELGLTLTLLVDVLSLVGLVQTLRGLKSPLPGIWRSTRAFHPFN